VFKNKKMPGHMGNKSRTTQNLKVVKIIPEKNILLLKGSVPGHKNSLLTVRVAKKLRKSS
jgi:large subunit ribosomal protein L3